MRSRLSTASRLNVAFLLIAAVGIVIQIVADVDYPRVPPGPIILVAAAAMVAFASWRWVPYVGVVVPLFLLIGGTIAFTVGDAADSIDGALAVVGTLIQWIAEGGALLTGLVALRQHRRQSPATASPWR